MASTFTTGFGIEKIGSGEQSGAWGTTTNHNLDILDRIASYKAVALSGTTHTLTVREASPGSGTENLQDGMYRVIKFTGALGANNTVTIAPNTAPAYFIFENATTDSASSGPYSVILTQGSGANITIQNGKNAIVYCDGAGSGAAVVNALSDLQIATLEVTGVAALDGAVTVGGASQFNSTVTVGVNGTGYDVQFFGATSGAHMLWDESADDLKLVGAAGLTVAGNIDVDGTTNLDAVDIDGAVQIDATLSVGVDGTGYDVTFYGDTASRYVKWDESADSLLFSDNAKAVFGQPGNDLQIVHDTNNSFITDAGTGNLYLDSNAGNIYLRVSASENALEAVGDGGVTLYYNGNPKIATVAGGVNVTGGTTSVGTGGVTIDATAGADANPELELTAVARQFNIGVGGATFATTAIRGSYYIYDATATAYRFSIDSSGNCGIGTTAPANLLQVGPVNATETINVVAASGGASMIMRSTGGTLGTLGSTNNVPVAFLANNGEKMRLLAAGNLCVGGTTVRNTGLISVDYTSASQGGMGINDTNSGNGGVHIGFLTGGTFRGSITNNNNTAVAYNTTSDARLKENLVPISDAIGRVNNLNPVKFNWIDNGSVSEGFIAQEILAGDEQLAADMVTGDPDGDAAAAPMQVDYAKITPLLTAALQQALAKIEELEARITALEG